MKEKINSVFSKVKEKFQSAKVRGVAAGMSSAAVLSVGAFAADGDPVTVTTITGQITSILTTALTWVGQVITTVTGTPLIMFFVLLGGIYIGVNMLRKLLHI